MAETKTENQKETKMQMTQTLKSDDLVNIGTQTASGKEA